jgi:hypothetical protein
VMILTFSVTQAPAKHHGQGTGFMVLPTPHAARSGSRNVWGKWAGVTGGGTRTIDFLNQALLVRASLVLPSAE